MLTVVVVLVFCWLTARTGRVRHVPASAWRTAATLLKSLLAAMPCVLQAWQPLPGSELLVTAGKDGRVLVYDTTLFADPDEEGMPKFSAPIAVAPEPQPDEATAVVWSAAGDARTIYVAHASGEVVVLYCGTACHAAAGAYFYAWQLLVCWNLASAAANWCT